MPASIEISSVSASFVLPALTRETPKGPHLLFVLRALFRRRWGAHCRSIGVWQHSEGASVRPRGPVLLRADKP